MSFYRFELTVSKYYLEHLFGMILAFDERRKWRKALTTLGTPALSRFQRSSYHSDTVTVGPNIDRLPVPPHQSQ